MQLLNRENQIPILSPDYIAVIEGEFFEFGFIEILVVLGMRMQTYELPDIDCLAGIVVEDKFNAEISGAPGRCDFQSAHFT